LVCAPTTPPATATTRRETARRERTGGSGSPKCGTASETARRHRAGGDHIAGIGGKPRYGDGRGSPPADPARTPRPERRAGDRFPGVSGHEAHVPVRTAACAASPPMHEALLAIPPAKAEG